MSNASLKDQLQAMALQISETVVVEARTEEQPTKNIGKIEKSNRPNKPGKQEKVSAAKPKWLVYMQYGVELLRAYFPLCFKSGNEVKPLKKGIKQDLIKQLSTMECVVTEDKACMVKSLAYYVNTAVYHKSVVEGAARIDLEGHSVGIVSAEEAKYSTERHQAKLQAKAKPSKPAQPSADVRNNT